MFVDTVLMTQKDAVVAKSIEPGPFSGGTLTPLSPLMVFTDFLGHVGRGDWRKEAAEAMVKQSCHSRVEFVQPLPRRRAPLVE